MNIIDYVFEFKININNFIQNKIQTNRFVLVDTLLYYDLENCINVKKYFDDHDISYIDNGLIETIFQFYKLDLQENDNIRLKIFFKFLNEDYISYIPYKKNNLFIPYPIYSDQILKNFKKDIIVPVFLKEPTKKYFYSFFGVDLKNIISVKINDEENNELLNYFKKIKTPFNDFGILFDNNIKLSWIVFENSLKDFECIEINFTNYFDEDSLELIDHKIILNKNELENIIISNKIKDVLSIKNK